MPRYIILGHDNRGTPESPFGYVSLGVNKRGAEVGRFGYSSDTANPGANLALWPTSDTPSDIDYVLVTSVRNYLKRKYPHIENVRSLTNPPRPQSRNRIAN
jgi:hypothetical protein